MTRFATMPFMHSARKRASFLSAPIRHAPAAPVSSLLLQRKPCSCGGSCPRCQTGTAGLKIGAPNDRYEREADAAADQIVRMTDPAIHVSPSGSALQRKCDGCEKEDEKHGKILQTKRSSQRDSRELMNGPAAPAIVQEVLSSPGQSLNAESRRFFEPRFGRDFSQVRVHVGEQAAQSAAAVAAIGYTVGRHIVLGKEAQALTPNRTLLAHELAHVVQQGGAPTLDAASAATSVTSAVRTGVQPQLQRQMATDDAAGGAVPASGGSCHYCNIPGGVGVCCYGENTPMVQECFDLATGIIDGCKGDAESCKQQAHCAQCRCIAEKKGKQYCQCTGIV